MRTTGASEIALLRLVVGTPSTSAAVVAETTSQIVHQGMVSSGSPMVITLSSTSQVTGTDFSNRNKGIHVYSNGTEPIFVVVETVITSINYGTYLAYPSLSFQSITSYEYVILSQESNILQSTFLLVGNLDNTSITIIPSQGVSLPSDTQTTSDLVSVEANTSSHTFLLNKIQTLLVQSGNDLTGTKVISSKPLTVVSGHECANVPLTSAAGCEPLAIHVPLRASWGTKFMLAPFAGRNGAQIFKAVTTTDNTSIVYTCGNMTRKNFTSREFQLSTNEYCYLESSDPIMVAQLSVGQTEDSLGDPAIAMISPINGYVHEIQFLSLSTGDFPRNYVSITVPDSPNGVLLDGVPIVCQWKTIYNSSNITIGYGCSLNVSSGASSPMQHRISNLNPNGLLSVIVYGFNTEPHQGYAYLSGQNISIVGKFWHYL